MSSNYRCGFLITQIKQVSGRTLDKILAKQGVDAFNGAQGRILDILWQKDQIPISEISRLTGLSAATLTGMLDRMEKAALVKRVPDNTDRRKLLIALTDEAQLLKENYLAVSSAMDNIYYQGFSEEEIASLQSYLERILANLENYQA